MCPFGTDRLDYGVCMFLCYYAYSCALMYTFFRVSVELGSLINEQTHELSDV